MATSRYTQQCKELAKTRSIETLKAERETIIADIKEAISKSAPSHATLVDCMEAYKKEYLKGNPGPISAVYKLLEKRAKKVSPYFFISEDSMGQLPSSMR